MSYQVLARKWRPASFEQVVGQSHVLHALTNALSQQRLHHAYLFSGTRGVGKTTLARLFAKGLNCELGVTAHPCGKCAACVEIAEGRFVDLIEVDAASRTKVDDTRELLDNVQYRPTRGRYKVYLIDEVHMLSRSSFNALLKTLEEPPEHVKFLLATTDPQKLPITVLSRCLQFNLKSLNLTDICSQLAYVLKQEHLDYDEKALNLLAKAANGSMRDALSLTDQAIAFGAGTVRTAEVQTMLGSIDDKQVVNLLNAVVQGEVANLLKLVTEILSLGADADEVLRSLLELLHQISLSQFSPAAAQLSQYADDVLAFTNSLQPEQVQLYYQILLNSRKDLPYAADPKSGLEMALLRTLAFLPEQPNQQWPSDGGMALPGKPKLTTQESSHQFTESKDKSAIKLVSEKEQSVVDNNLKKTSVNQITTATGLIASESKQEDEIAAEQALILSQAESMGYDIPQSTQVLESTSTQLEPESQGDDYSSPQGHFDDDLLEAVLASRQALMSSLSQFTEPQPSNEPVGIAAPKLLSSPHLASDDMNVQEHVDASIESIPQTDSAITPVESDKVYADIKPSLSSVQLETQVSEDSPPWEAFPSDNETISQVVYQVDNEKHKAEHAHQLDEANLSSNPQPTWDINGNHDDLAWYKRVLKLTIRGRVRQLAVNSLFLGEDNSQLNLLLKSNQKHLAASVAIGQLQQAITDQLGKPIKVDIQVGDELSRETPLEVKKRFHQELLVEAQHALYEDENISWLQQQMGAELELDSVDYPKELLLQKSDCIRLD